MASAKAQSEKEKGNAAFKKGDYPTAIGHYTAASLADRTDPTFPLNRAAAYLKLGKNEDAERDCTSALSLSALNAKALFRRGQARIGLGKLDDALADLKQALQREPTNESVREEIKKVDDLIAKGKPKVPKSVPLATSPQPSAAKRRRVPIKIIDSTSATTAAATSPPASSTPTQSIPKPAAATPGPVKTPIPGPPHSKTASETATDTLKPVSTRFLNKEKEKEPQPQPSPQPQAKTEPKPQPIPGPYSSWRPDLPTTTATSAGAGPQASTFSEAKQAREGRVGGGIFRASGTSTIFPTRSSPGPSGAPVTGNGTASAPEPASVVKPKAPITLFDFSRAWEMERGVEERWSLLQTIPPSSLPSLFKTSLEPALFVSIVAVFEYVLGVYNDTSVGVREYVDAFGRVPRFGTVLLFLSKEEKARVRKVWEMLGVRGAAIEGDVDKAWKPIWT